MPSAFSSLVGNATVKMLLEQMFARGSLPPVLLFYGPAGIGKTLFAKVLAERLTQTTKKEAPDIHALTPEGKTYHHPIETIREMIGRWAYLLLRLLVKYLSLKMPIECFRHLATRF
jgi:replication-associated recombination protein RarA